jgi:hypothetical protein
MLSQSISVPSTLNTLGAATPMTGFQFNGGITIQLPATAAAGDQVAIYGGNIPNASSTAQLQQVAQLGIPQGGETGQQPSAIAAATFLYFYAIRLAGTSGVLTATMVGATDTSGGSGSANAILQGGNTFGAEIHIGANDGNNVVIGSYAGSNTTGLTLDTTTTGAVNLGTGAFAKTVTVGNVTGATAVNVKFGTGGLGLGVAAPGSSGIAASAATIALTSTAANITLTTSLGSSGEVVLSGDGGVMITTGTNGGFGVTTSAGEPATIVSGTSGVVEINSGTTGDVNLGTGLAGADAFAKTVRLGTGAGAKTLLIGSNNTTSSGQFLVGSGGLGLGVAAVASSVTIDVPAAGTINVGNTNATSFNVGTSGNIAAYNIGTAATAATVDLFNGAAAYNVTLGSTTGSSTMLVQFGSGGLGLGVAAPGSSGITIDTPVAGTISIGTTHATTLTMGAGALTSATLNVAATGTIGIGQAAAAVTLTLGNATGASAASLLSGSGALIVNSTTGTVNLGTGTGGADANAKAVNVATGAGAKTLVMGSTNTTSSTTVNSGTGATTLAGPTLWGAPVALGNFASGGSIGSAATTVDITSLITVAQTTAAQTLTLSAPTLATTGRMVMIMNIGSAAFTMLGKTVAAEAANANSVVFAFWDATNSRWTTNA